MGGNVEFELISEQESWDVFDDASQRLLGIPGADFASRWDAGEYASADEINVMQVAMLRPSGRG